MSLLYTKGKIRFLRVQEDKNYGPAHDPIHAQAIVALEGHDGSFGFSLGHDDPNLPSRLAMLRDGYFQGREVTLTYDRPQGKEHGYLIRVIVD